jgi:E3 ubiquitin-protein ligase HUWE1
LNIADSGHEERSRKASGAYGYLPVARAAIMKHALRSIHRMMQSSGTTEGLRGLIDSSILQSIRKIIEYRGLFGPSIFPIGKPYIFKAYGAILIIHIAINIMATFVHNEPTALPIIQDSGLPEEFYRAVESGIEPVIEVWITIHNFYSRQFYSYDITILSASSSHSQRYWRLVP